LCAQLYALVARGKTVLAEYTFTSGNFPTITRVLLGKIPEQDGKMSYVYDQCVCTRFDPAFNPLCVCAHLCRHVFHYIVEDKITYLCMCDETNKRRIPFAFLEDIKNRFKATYGERAHTAIAFAMNEDFGRSLQKQMDFYNSPSADNFATVNSKLDDVKNVMVQNIEMVLERGEKLELLVDKTDKLQHQAFKFEKSSKKLKNAMFWKRVKLYLLLFFVVALIIYVISAIACGPTYKKC
jgi:vesicle-associated membrane protein 7